MTLKRQNNGNSLGSGEVEGRYVKQRNETEHDFSGTTSDENLRLASVDTDYHMNFIVKNALKHTAITISALEAMKVRDALIEIYPLPEVAPEPGEYKVRDRLHTMRMGHRRFVVEQERMEPTTVVVAETNDPINATKIAKALNEAEGL